MNTSPRLHAAATNPRMRRLLLRFAGIAGADLVSQGVRILVVAWPLDATSASLLVAEIARNSIPLAAGVAVALDLFESSAGRWSVHLRWLAMTTAIVTVGATTSAFMSSNVAVRLGLAESGQSLALHTLWHNVSVALLAVAYLTRRRESTEAEQRRRLQVSRLEHVRRRLAMVSSQAAQSRLDPQMLFDCLSRAREVYPNDLDRGDAMVERLTNYLRLTLSLGSSETSTLGREASLAAARFDVDRRDVDPPFIVAIDPALESHDFPPDLLALLTQRWMASAPAGQPRSLQLATVAGSGSLRLSLRGSCRPPSEAVAQCEQQIAKIGGGFVRYVDSDPTHLELEIAHVD